VSGIVSSRRLHVVFVFARLIVFTRLIELVSLLRTPPPGFLPTVAMFQRARASRSLNNAAVLLMVLLVTVRSAVAPRLTITGSASDSGAETLLRLTVLRCQRLAM
jgi:hypothetical protein